MRSAHDGTLSSEDPGSPRSGSPEIVRMDCTGMRCPQPVLRLAVETAGIAAGTVVEIVGDCPTFEKDVRVFCKRRKKTLLAVLFEDAKTFIRIQY